MSPTTQQVWEAIDDAIFGVLGFVTPKGRPRTAGVVYMVSERSLLIPSARDSWKVRHIARTPHVSMTVTIPKRIPFMPFIRVPAATVTFRGEAELLDISDLGADQKARLFRSHEMDPDAMRELAIIRVVPRGEFVTYGIAMSTIRMRNPEEARGRAPCGTDHVPVLAAH